MTVSFVQQTGASVRHRFHSETVDGPVLCHPGVFQRSAARKPLKRAVAVPGSRVRLMLNRTDLENV